MTPWATCSSCAGHGLVTGWSNGEPEVCPSCGGNGTERARDSRGRFTLLPKKQKSAKQKKQIPR